MGDRDTLYRLTDIIEFDDALIGKKPGKRGRGADGKVSILVACEIGNGRPGFLAMEAVAPIFNDLWFIFLPYCLISARCLPCRLIHAVLSNQSVVSLPAGAFPPPC